MTTPGRPAGHQPSGHAPEGHLPEGGTADDNDVWLTPLRAYRASQEGYAGPDVQLIRLGRRIATGRWD